MDSNLGFHTMDQKSRFSATSNTGLFGFHKDPAPHNASVWGVNKDKEVNNWCPKQPQLQLFQHRMDSFKQWTFANVLPAQLMALAGFHKCPGTVDTVICYYCELKCSAWCMLDNPINEHVRHNKNCMHIKTITSTATATACDTVC